MGTYYKYAERNAETRINWAEVGKDMTDMVREESRIRQEKKAAIDQQSREFGEYMANPPMGEHQGFNEFTTQFAADSQEYSLMVEGLVKSGQINVRDYTNIRANLQQGAAEAFTISEEYNKHYEDAMQRGEIDPATGYPSSQAYEQWVLGTAQGFGNYSNHRLYINPTDGRVNLGTLDDKGRIKKEIGSYIPVNGLRNRVQTKYDYFNTDKTTGDIAGQLGQVIEVIKKGGVLTREDTTEHEDFKSALDNFVGAQFAIPTNVSSILTNSLGTNPDTQAPYDFTDSPKEAAENPNLILSIANPMQPDSGIPMPAFGVDLREVLKDTGLTETEIQAVIDNNEAQVKAAGDALKIGVKSKLDYKEEATPIFKQTKDDRKIASDVKETETAITNLGYIYNGTEDQFNSAIGFIQGLDPSISRVYVDEKDPNLVWVEKRDTKGNIITMEPFPKGDNIDDFVVSIITTLVPNAVDVEKALANSGIDRNAAKTTHAGVAGESRKPVAPVIPTFDEKLDADDEYSDTPAGVHAEEFKGIGARDGKKLSNAETSFFSKIGIPNAKVTYLDEGKIEAGIIGSNWDNDAVQIMIPGVMTMPIMIPDNNTSTQYEKINRIILDAIRNGTVLTPNDFKSVIDDFAQYNNTTMAEKVIGLEWNGGMGPQPITDDQASTAQTQTPSTTTNTS
ncbi:MAG TPA: hypothetical protein EYN64_04625, partial [Flavobacteriales bacterium]|nr:hypothetical protein [Flavobacteriales bacterium]